MIGRTLLGALVAVALLSGPVATARACHFFDRCCGKPATTTYYAPVAAPAPVCCARPQVVNYMPQTCYRTVYMNAPVVTYRPTTACDACGRATTVMRPVTTYVAQPRLVPYTTYRPVVTAMPAAQPCCGAAPVVRNYAPAVSVAPAAPAAPACCSPASTTTITPTPSLSTYSPAPSTTVAPSNAPGATLQNLTPAPSSNSTSPSQPKQTFESSPSDINAPQSRVLMPPSSSSSSTLSKRPRGLDPQDRDRTTAIPLRNGPAVRQASLVTPAKAETKTADDGGWRAGSK